MKIVVPVTACVDLLQSYQLSTDSQKIINYQPILNPWDEFALEAALQMKDSFDAEVIALSVGNNDAVFALRKALALGCDSAVQISFEPDQFANHRLASLITAAIHKISAVDLVCFGRQSIDYENGTLAALTAANLGWTFISMVNSVESLNPSSLTVKKVALEQRWTLRANLPLVLSINKDFGEPRFPSFMGTRKAAKAEIPVWYLEQSIELGNYQDNPQVSLENAIIPEVESQIFSGLSIIEAVGLLEEKLKEGLHR